MDCEFKKEKDGKNICEIASGFAGIDAEVTDGACKVCVGCPMPKHLNRVTASLACNAVRQKEPERFPEMATKALPYLEKQIRMSEKAKSYTSSTATWIASGAKIRDDEEVARLLVICQKCPSYQPATEDSGSCGVCGCQVSLGGAFTNKLRRQGEGCPLDKW